MILNVELATNNKPGIVFASDRFVGTTYDEQNTSIPGGVESSTYVRLPRLAANIC
jgi:hypothetical protein